MKPLEDLTQHDLEQFPVWTLREPAKSEAEPWTKPGGAPLLAIVAAECVAADGSRYPGFGLLTKLSVVSPVVFAGGRQIKLFHGMTAPSEEFKAQAYAALGKSADQFFPVQIRVAVKSQFHPPPVSYDGFLYRSADGGFGSVR